MALCLGLEKIWGEGVLDPGRHHGMTTNGNGGAATHGEVALRCRALIFALKILLSRTLNSWLLSPHGMKSESHSGTSKRPSSSLIS